MLRDFFRAPLSRDTNPTLRWQKLLQIQWLECKHLYTTSINPPPREKQDG